MAAFLLSHLAYAFILTLLLAAALCRPLQNGWYALHLLLAGVAAWRLQPLSPALALGIHLLFINGVTFLAYAWDKRAAKRGGHRVRERTLHGLALAGGTPAALLGRKLLRHKTRKESFLRDFRLIVFVQLLLLGLVFWFLMRLR